MHRGACLAGYSPWHPKESDTTEGLHTWYIKLHEKHCQNSNKKSSNTIFYSKILI